MPPMPIKCTLSLHRKSLPTPRLVTPFSLTVKAEVLTQTYQALCELTTSPLAPLGSLTYLP